MDAINERQTRQSARFVILDNSPDVRKLLDSLRYLAYDHLCAISDISTSAKVLRYEEEIKGASSLVCTFAFCLFTFAFLLSLSDAALGLCDAILRQEFASQLDRGWHIMLLEPTRWQRQLCEDYE